MADTKICIVCGEDCSDRPRLKNSSGRYACRACIKAKRQAREVFRAERAQRIASHDPTEAAVSPIYANLNDTSDWMAADTIEAATHGRHGPQCPVCGKVTRGDGLICDECRERARTIESGHDNPAFVDDAPPIVEQRTSRTNPVDLLQALQAVSPPPQPTEPRPAPFELARVLQGSVGASVGIVALWGGAVALVGESPLWLMPIVGIMAGSGIALSCGMRRGSMQGAAAVVTFAIAIAIGQVAGDEARTARDQSSQPEPAETEPEAATEASIDTAPASQLDPVGWALILAGAAAAWGIGRGNGR